MSFFLQICLVSWCMLLFSSNIVCSEYYVSSNYPPSYLEHLFPTTTETIFPSEISLNVIFTAIEGTLLYSIDKNGNQLIIRASNGGDAQLLIEFRGKEMSVPLKSLCDCSPCKYVPLLISLKIDSSALQLQCNHRIKNTATMQINQQKIIYKKYPKIEDVGGDAAIWLVNTPKIGDVYPEALQMQGCVSDIRYNGRELKMTAVGGSIKNGCERSCKENTCRDGVCFDNFREPICDCSTSYGSGPRCEDGSKPVNSKIFMLKKFVSLKVSWKSNSSEIMEIGNDNTVIKLLQEGRRLLIRQEYGENNQNNFVATYYLTDDYQKGKEYVLTMAFGKTSVFKLVGISTTTTYVTTKDMTKETFRFLTLSSGKGMIDIAYLDKGSNAQWKQLRLDEFIRVDLPAKQKVSDVPTSGKKETAVTEKDPSNSQKDKADVKTDNCNLVYISQLVIIALLIVILVIVTLIFLRLKNSEKRRAFPGDDPSSRFLLLDNNYRATTPIKKPFEKSVTSGSTECQRQKTNCPDIHDDDDKAKVV